MIRYDSRLTNFAGVLVFFQMVDLLDIEMEPVWQSARVARERTQQRLMEVDVPGHVGPMLGMVACELTENAVKYANLQSSDPIRLSLSRTPSHVEVQVSSTLGDEARQHYERLKNTLDWLADFEDPMDAYVERMQAIALSEPDATQGTSGLGLARIACEGKAQLSCELDAEMNLHVRARHHLE